jgi:hypothetical protein
LVVVLAETPIVATPIVSTAPFVLPPALSTFSFATLAFAAILVTLAILFAELFLCIAATCKSMVGFGRDVAQSNAVRALFLRRARLCLPASRSSLLLNWRLWHHDCWCWAITHSLYVHVHGLVESCLEELALGKTRIKPHKVGWLHFAAKKSPEVCSYPFDELRQYS